MKKPRAALPFGQALQRGPPCAAARARPAAGAVPERVKATTFRSWVVVYHCPDTMF